jgi:hypothetical protein
MFQLSVWCEKLVAAGHNSVIGNQLLFANNRNRVRWVVLCLSHDGACTDSFENFRKISLKGDLSNDITLIPPLFSLFNTFCSAQTRTGIGHLRNPQELNWFLAVESHLGVRAPYATPHKLRYEANKCGWSWTQPLFRKARDRGVN